MTPSWQSRQMIPEMSQRDDIGVCGMSTKSRSGYLTFWVSSVSPWGERHSFSLLTKHKPDERFDLDKDSLLT